MITREALEAQIAELERRKVSTIMQLMAKFRTSALDATDRAAGAQTRTTMADARLMRIHHETAAMDAEIAQLRAALDLL